ncbi:MAG: hypothetical protein M1832_001695 [Thelocarpon impressellum]|nr:MAG: hypothetical protein M1832_001695 [Thelocarpon impressellum]
MAGAASQSVTPPERITKHMNKDHQDSLTRFLEYYCALPAASVRGALLEDITLERMVITSTAGRNVVFFDPPLGSWSEVRPRVVEMDWAAHAGLGWSNIGITEYERPRGFHAVVFITCAVTFVAFCRQQNFLPGSWLYDKLLHNFPTYTGWMRKIQPFVFYLMVLIHAGEAVWLDRSRLSRHGVPRLSPLWWKWIASCFIEGVGTFQRIDARVRRKQKAKDAEKH